MHGDTHRTMVRRLCSVLIMTLKGTCSTAYTLGWMNEKTTAMHWLIIVYMYFNVSVFDIAIRLRCVITISPGYSKLQVDQKYVQCQWKAIIYVGYIFDRYWNIIFNCNVPTVILGPDKWCEGFPIANGPRQSPIDIVPGEAAFDAALKALTLKYDPSTSIDILNNGHSFQVTYTDDNDNSS